MRTRNLILPAILLMLSGTSLAAEFGDNCTTSLSQGSLFQADCKVSAMHEGKTYCFGSEAAREMFLQDPQSTIMKAQTFYAQNAASQRQKISQADAMTQIKSKRCDLSNKDAGYLELDGMDLRHCKMVNTSFFGAYLRGAKLSGANLQSAYLNLARLEKADLSSANLTDARIFQAIFDQTNFRGANLTNARMIGTLGNVDMSGANVVKGRFGLDIGNQPMGAMRFDAVGGRFAETNFEGADINRANLQFADLRKANLRKADLFRADLSKADLTGADLTGANLKEAILDGTVMTGVKGLEAIQGYDTSKGKCIDCAIADKAVAAETAVSISAAASKQASACMVQHQ